MKKEPEKKFIETIRETRNKIAREIMNLHADEIVDFYKKRLSEIQKIRQTKKPCTPNITKITRQPPV